MAAGSPRPPLDLADLRRRHVEAPWYPLKGKPRAGSQCQACNRSWPCDASRLLDLLGVEARAEAGLDAAWKAAEAALPDGYGLRLTWPWGDSWYAEVGTQRHGEFDVWMGEQADTPAEALQALAVRLS